MLESNGGSSLPVTGGRWRSKVDSASFGDVIRVGSASTFVEGLFDDVQQAVRKDADFVRQRMRPRDHDEPEILGCAPARQ